MSEDEGPWFIEAKEQFGQTLQGKPASHDCGENTVESSLKQSQSYP